VEVQMAVAKGLEVKGQTGGARTPAIKITNRKAKVIRFFSMAARVTLTIRP
jgi:hypothetical protein